MFKNKKINLTFLVIIIGILFIYVGNTFSKYMYENKYDIYLKSNGFYFYSNWLTIDNKQYSFDNWDGLEYTFNIELYNYENLDSWTDKNIDYDFKVSCTGDVTCTTNYGTSEYSGTLTYNSVKYTNNIIQVIVRANSEDVVGTRVNVEAKSTSQYKKKISATFNLNKNNYGLFYEINDSVGSSYATLVIRNSTTVDKSINISLSRDIASFDMTNQYIIDAVNNSQYLINDNLVTVKLEVQKNSDLKIKLFKEDITSNYSFPINDYSIVTIS